MKKIYLLISLFFIVFIGSSQNIDRSSIIEEILIKSKNIEEINELLYFIDTHNLNYPQIFRYLPNINPINPKNDPTISSTFSSKRLHPIYNQYKSHNGIDIVAPSKTPIYAAAAGSVKKAKFYNGSAGHSVVIDHKYGFQTKYFHLLFFIVKAGDKVNKGDLIGYLGSTGGVTGAHLHFEVLKNNKHLNPIHFLN